MWGVGVDDCEFQRLILGGIFEQVGLPHSRVDILGERPEDLEGLTDSLVRLMRERLPAHARVLAIVDENLDREDASLTISGSHAVQAALDRIGVSSEKVRTAGSFGPGKLPLCPGRSCLCAQAAAASVPPPQVPAAP